MPRHAALLVLTLVVALIVATAGCIEVKEKPPRGPFHIEVESEEMFFMDDSGGPLVGPHGHVETDIPHAHEEYAWDIEDLGEFEGAEVDLPAHDVGVRKASYNIHFIDQENHTGLSVATVPDLSGIYFVIGDGIGLAADDDDTQTLDLQVLKGENLTEISSHDGWTIMEYAGRLSDPMVVNLHHDESNEGNVTYLVGIHVTSGDLILEDVGSVRIQPGQYHRLWYLDGELRLFIFDEFPLLIDAQDIWNGSYEDLPKEYRTHIGHLDWEGHVGEPEEAPGFGTLMSVLAMSTVAVLVLRRRREG
ncbi:MAG: hypothetical protein JSW25_08945 [Thermoplasmata archaeon]|nr:MAG: hypothetical protein JSW25_08945 [Thermoplasmata archaeon]